MSDDGRAGSDAAAEPDGTAESRAREIFAGMVETLPIGLIGFHGPDLVVVGANRVARAFFADRPGIPGRSLREVYPEFEGQHVLEFVERVGTTGEPFAATEWRVMVDGPDGSVERFADFDLSPVRDAAGTITGVACTFQDVTDRVLERQAMESHTAELRERYRTAQDAVLALQRTLLPERLPVLPGFRLAARYLVAAAEQAAGGDWFDAVPMDGKVVMVVGDVVGHGAAASAVMGQLRALLTEFVCDGDDLDVALSRLDRFAGRNAGARGATVCLARLDPEDGSVRYACAGHPPPLVTGSDGGTRLLPAPVGVPLGVAGPGPEVATAFLRPGDLLVCYSDGLVERAGQPLSEGLGELAKVASAAVRRGTPSLAEVGIADRVAELVMERMTRDGYTDDVTVLVAEVTGLEAPALRADLPAEAGQCAGLRRELETWLVELGASHEDVMSTELAVLEAVANVIEHAYPGPGGRMLVEGVVDGDGRVQLTVSDSGRWKPASPDPGLRGRGLRMMRGAMDSIEIESGEDGTTVLLDRLLSHPPVLGVEACDERRSRRVGPTELTVSVARSEEPRVKLAGPVDIATAGRLRTELWSASRGGALPLTVDVGSVTHLASTGIALLFEFVEEMAVGGREVRLVAPPDCPARHAMAVSGLDRIAAVTGD